MPVEPERRRQSLEPWLYEERRRQSEARTGRVGITYGVVGALGVKYACAHWDITGIWVLLIGFRVGALVGLKIHRPRPPAT